MAQFTALSMAPWSPEGWEPLVEHRESLQVGMTVEEVNVRFRHHPHEFAAVLDGETYIGLISRGHLGFLLGTRFGFAVHSRHLVQDHVLPPGLVAVTDMTLMALLEKALPRTGENFYRDVPLLDDRKRFLGIIPVPTLVRAQSSLISAQARLAETQRLELLMKNKDLFRSLHQLRQSQARYETLFEHSPLPVALLHSDGRIEAPNARFQAMLGTDSATTGPLINLADLIHAKHREAFLKLLAIREKGIDPPGNHPDEFPLRGPDGRERLFKFHTALIRETGQLCTILDDVTEQRALEHKIAIKDKANLLESLVGGIAHELNNKLSPVLGFSELLALRLDGRGGEEKLQSYCNSISSSAKEAVQIVRQLLQLSRPATMELQAVDLGSILEEVTSIMRFRLQAAGVTLTILVAEGGVRILADAAQIKQVLINLMINAADAMERTARKELEVRVEPQGASATVFVEDTGHGIASENLTRIFDPFFTSKSSEKGTGLGLSVCLGIVRRHHGEISVNSVPGEGTVFTLQLPLAPPDLRESQPWSHTDRPSASRAPALSTMEPGHRSVLVIDDEEYVTNLIQELLRNLGWRIERAHDGREAIKRMESTRFDLVITDLRMPGMDGFAIIDWISHFRPALRSRVLVVTGDAGSLSLDQELAGLGVPVLMKPFTPDQLLARCRELLADAPALPCAAS